MPNLPAAIGGVPAVPHSLPATIAGHHVVGALRIPPRVDEVPDQAVIIGWNPARHESRAFVVWDAAVRDGKWTAFTGDYELSYPRALEEFVLRVRSRTGYLNEV